MANIDLPTMQAANYASQTYSGLGQAMGVTRTLTTAADMIGTWNLRKDAGAPVVPYQSRWIGGIQPWLQPLRIPGDDTLPDDAFNRYNRPDPQPEPKKEPKNMTKPNEPSCRLVRVIVVDPHQSVPMANKVLYMGQENMTDATDQELFMEIAAELQAKLLEHNKLRVAWTEKKGADSEKARKLEPARIRDLNMTVVTIASF